MLQFAHHGDAVRLAHPVTLGTLGCSQCFFTSTAERNMSIRDFLWALGVTLPARLLAVLQMWRVTHVAASTRG